jgi:alpha-1,3-glucosyltransferase
MFLLLNPSFVLIDHGHFQYNCVCLGLTLGAIVLIKNKHHLVGSFFFVAAMCFKQMGLYYAPAFFFFLLKVCHSGSKSWGGRIVSVLKLGIVVLASFSLFLLPFLSSLDQVMQVFVRVFPFGRGLFEDKVANFWCASSLVVKWKLLFTSQTLVRIRYYFANSPQYSSLSFSLLLTVLSLIPNAILTLSSPSHDATNFILSLCHSSMSFYLFSFQVHEKTILFVLLPVSLLILRFPRFVSWFSSIACFR